MPSVILGNQSGGQMIISGNPYSGHLEPVGGIQLLWISSGGNCYIGMSGGMTVTSGAVQGSGGCLSGMLDGMLIPPGGVYFIPTLGLGSRGGSTSGIWNIFASCDAAASGVGRLYFEAF